MNIHTVEQVVTLLAEHAVSEIEVETGSERIYVRRSSPPISPPFMPLDTSAPAPDLADAFVPTEPLIPETFLLTAPMVGVFHHASPSVNAGTSVQAGQKIGAIEAMKLMNDVKLDEGGRVLEVLADDGGPVEYGQPLLRLQRQTAPIAD